ncbi:MAG: CarD family transcriptional regulator [Bacillota bacterium]|nr:CarD family transcriptional regulator [Bacillota bacterium]
MDGERFEKGSYVVYGTNGICTVEDVKLMSFASGMEKNMYYILKPLSNPSSTIFVPVKNEELMSKMRDPMTKEEIDRLLMEMRDKEFEWEDDRRFRAESFHDILTRGVHQEMMMMIRCIYMRKQELSEEGRKLAATDTNTLKAAEKLVEEEFAHVLGIKPEEVGKYIRKTLNMPDEDTGL